MKSRDCDWVGVRPPQATTFCKKREKCPKTAQKKCKKIFRRRLLGEKSVGNPRNHRIWKARPRFGGGSEKFEELTAPDPERREFHAPFRHYQDLPGGLGTGMCCVLNFRKMGQNGVKISVGACPEIILCNFFYGDIPAKSYERFRHARALFVAFDARKTHFLLF